MAHTAKIRVRSGPPRIFSFGREDLFLDNENGILYFKDRRGKLKAILSPDPTSALSKISKGTAGIALSGSNAIFNHITASGNISASGTVFADTFESHGETFIGIADSINVTGSVIATSITSTGLIDAPGETGSFGYISCSGDISSSGIIHTDTLRAGKGTIEVHGHLVPETDYIYDLGSATKRWRDLHLNSSSIKFYDNDGLIGALTYDRAGGLKVADNADAETIISASIIYATGNIISKQNVIASGNITSSGNISASGDLYGSNLYINATGQNVIQVGNTGNTLSKWEWHRDNARKWVIYNDGRTSPSLIQDGLHFKSGISSDSDATHLNMVLTPTQGVKFYGPITGSKNISSSGEVIAASGSFDIIEGGVF